MKRCFFAPSINDTGSVIIDVTFVKDSVGFSRLLLSLVDINMKYSTALVILSIVAIASCMPNPQPRRHRPRIGGFGGEPGYGNQGFGGGPSFGGSG